MSKEYIWKLSDISRVNQNGLKVFSCFSCGVGSTMGYKLAGFEVLGNNEIDEKINAMYVKNHHPKCNFNCAIRKLVNMDLPDELYELDVLDGSPPRSVFSVAEKREKAGALKKHLKKGRKSND